MKPQFKRLLQIGIIVRNVDESVKLFEEHYGMGPWHIVQMDGDTFPGLTFNGQSGMANKCAMCRAYGMELELIEPLTDGIFKQWLDEHGPGVHHLAFVTQDKFDKVLEKNMELTGKGPWVRGRTPDGHMDFSYFDLTEQLGFFAEVYNEDRDFPTGHDF